MLGMAEITKWVAIGGSQEGISTNWHGSINTTQRMRCCLSTLVGIWFALCFAVAKGFCSNEGRKIRHVWLLMSSKSTCSSGLHPTLSKVSLTCLLYLFPDSGSNGSVNIRSTCHICIYIYTCIISNAYVCLNSDTSTWIYIHHICIYAHESNCMCFICILHIDNLHKMYIYIYTGRMKVMLVEHHKMWNPFPLESFNGHLLFYSAVGFLAPRRLKSY